VREPCTDQQYGCPILGGLSLKLAGPALKSEGSSYSRTPALTYLLTEVVVVTVSIKKMSAGKGYEYFLRTVAVGDGDRSLSTPLTRYYTEEGTPPGRWIGSGLASLESPIKTGDEVTEEQLCRLLGEAKHPITGDKLGQRYRSYKEPEEGKRRHAVAGFDLTFSIPKSASVLWGVSDAGTQAIIADAHHAAVADALDFLERELLATRAGAKGANGGVVQFDTTGLIAAEFDHYDSRANDPHLHTHVVISNRVRTTHDGVWRTIDGEPLHKWTVAVSELHQAIFSDHLTRSLGISWERRARGRDRNPAWEIVGAPQTLVEKFSSRSGAINDKTDLLIKKYVAKHGHRPLGPAIMKLRQQATLMSRPEKRIHSLADLTTYWRRCAGGYLGEDVIAWARELTTTADARMLRADDVPLDVIEELGRTVVAVVGEKRSTWRRPNLYAEAARQTLDWRFVNTADREAITAMIVDAAEQGSLRLTPPALVTTPEAFTREDGTSRFRPRYSTVYSSEQLLAAEDRLLERATATNGPTVDIESVDRITEQPVKGHRLSTEQIQAVAMVAVSGRQVDVLVGPAGAGKTTAMRALHRAWTAQRGRGSVVGLAPSAAAAGVLADDLGIHCENTAKWLYEHQQGRAMFQAGQLVIIDEATLAGTHTLDQITNHASAVGAKVLLVGDWAQLQSVEAGGAFAMLVDARGDAPELADIHRFTHEWEKAASLNLRHGRPEAVDTYVVNARVRDGDTETALDDAYLAWQHDTARGKASVLIADNTNAVRDLNERARSARLVTGDVSERSHVRLVEGTSASAGDWVITRKNDRRLRTVRNGWVRNGDCWTVADVRKDGSLVVRRQGKKYGGAIVLPSAYVARHVDLGYAVTAHRAQGLTVDTAHVVVSENTTRENLYVAMTRGREANMAYVAFTTADDNHGSPNEETPTTKSVLLGVLANSGAELSAHQTVKAEQDTWASIAQLAAEYETIAAAAQRDRWASLIRACSLTPADAESAIESEAFGPLAAELRRAEANGHNVEQLLPAAVARHGLDDAEDVAAVLRHRLALATKTSGSGRGRRPTKLIVGFIPEALGSMAPDMRQALDERRNLIEQRAAALAEEAIRTKAPWVRRLGDLPQDRRDRALWQRAVMTIAAYRDRYGVESPTPLGPEPTTDIQSLDRARAESGLRRARVDAASTQSVSSGRAALGL
jgi:conjugative relaxase-like TrwC/TraI family protein